MSDEWSNYHEFRKRTDPPPWGSGLPDKICDIEGCSEIATQIHGIPEHLIYTCDVHAEQVMLEILQAIFGGENE